MKTKPLYLDDPYLKSMEATILEVLPEKEGVYRLILEQTVFYPMGGGQPTDQGFLTFSDGTKAEVYQVLLKEGEINHYVKTLSAPKVGEKIHGEIEWERRFKNMRVHTAGHVVDFAIHLLGYSPTPLYPTKGDHGKKPFVIYTGLLKKDIKEELQKKVDELTSQDFKFSWSFEPLEVLEKEAIYLQPGLPKSKPLRCLRLEGVGAVADGGTILSSMKEVGKVTILSVECNEAETTVRYQVEM